MLGSHVLFYRKQVILFLVVLVFHEAPAAMGHVCQMYESNETSIFLSSLVTAAKRCTTVTVGAVLFLIFFSINAHCDVSLRAEPSMDGNNCKGRMESFYDKT